MKNMKKYLGKDVKTMIYNIVRRGKRSRNPKFYYDAPEKLSQVMLGYDKSTKGKE